MTTSVTASGPSTQAQSDREANWRNVMSGLSNPIKWAGGGLAVLALAAMLSVGSGGGGLLGGLLGGMLAHRLLGSPSTAAATPAKAGLQGASGTASTTVARGGFGASGGSHGGGIGS